jgi:hypothetical protein
MAIASRGRLASRRRAISFLDAWAFVLFEPAEGVVGDVAASEGVSEDSPQRNERAVDRFRREALGAEAADHRSDVVSRDVGQSLVAQRGEQVPY